MTVERHSATVTGCDSKQHVKSMTGSSLERAFLALSEGRARSMLPLALSSALKRSEVRGRSCRERPQLLGQHSRERCTTCVPRAQPRAHACLSERENRKRNACNTSSPPRSRAPLPSRSAAQSSGVSIHSLAKQGQVPGLAPPRRCAGVLGSSRSQTPASAGGGDCSQGKATVYR